jgi:hypothetical protein
LLTRRALAKSFYDSLIRFFESFLVT